MPGARRVAHRDYMEGISSGRLRLQDAGAPGWVVVATDPTDPTDHVRQRPRRFSPAAGPTLVGRDREIELAAGSVRAGVPLEFYAGCDYGRTALLRALRSELHTRLGVRTVYLDTLGRPPDDVLHRVALQVVETTGRVRIPAAEATRLIRELRPVVLLDDVAWTPQQLATVLAQLSGCGVVLATDRPRLAGRGPRDGSGSGLLRTPPMLTRSHRLPGLDDAAAQALVARELARPLTGPERRAALRVSTVVDGRPGALLRAAARARDGGETLAGLAERLERDPAAAEHTDPLPRKSVSVLVLLLMAAGAAIPPDALTVATGVRDVARTIHGLARVAPVSSGDGGVAIARCAQDRGERSMMGLLELGGALRSIADWVASRDPTGPEALGAADGLVSLIGEAARRRQWETVVRLVHVVEPVLTLAGRWDACRRVLHDGVDAATQLGDSSASAWFLHQSGTLALGLGLRADAESELRRALALRERAGEAQAARVTADNLHRLPPQPAAAANPAPTAGSTAPTASRSLFAGGLVAAAAVALVVSAVWNPGGTEEPDPPRTIVATARATTTAPSTTQGTTDPKLPPGSPDHHPDPARPVLRIAEATLRTHVGKPVAASFWIANAGGLPLTALKTSIVGDPGFGIIGDCLPVPIPPGGTCKGVLAFLPEVPGPAAATLSVTDEDGGATEAELTAEGFLVLFVVQPDGAVLDATWDPGESESCTGPCVIELAQPGPIPVTLTAVSGCDGCVLAGWSDDACSKVSVCHVTVSEDARIVVTWEPAAPGSESAS